MPDHAELIRLPFPDDDSLGYGATPDISRDREGCASILPVPKHQHWHLWLLIPASIACVILFAVGQCGREWGIEFILGSGESRRSSTLKSFNLFDSIKALQDEDRLSLAILLWITSVIWPYMKIVLNLCIFFVTIKAPSAIKGLSWVEALGKWNHVDVIVLLDGAGHSNQD